jgi:FtsK/SpoIIIE family/FtsK alpha domain
VCEKDAIKMYRINNSTIALKNEKRFESEFLIGTPDLILDDKIVDTKCPYLVSTWFGYTEKKAIDEYQWQMVAYMILCNKKKSELAICGINTPDYLVIEECRDACYKARVNPDNEEEMANIEFQVQALHNFDIWPEKYRIRSFEINLTDDLVAKLESKLTACRQFMLELAQSDPNLAYQKKRSLLTTEHGSDLSIVDQIITKYNEFGIEIKFDEVITGASVLQYRFTLLSSGKKIEQLGKYNADIQALLKTDSVLIETPIPKTGQIGIQVPREDRQFVQAPMVTREHYLDLPIGQTIDGQRYYLNLAKAPHLLIAGATGSGKSVLLKNIIQELLFNEFNVKILDPKFELGGICYPTQILIYLEHVIKTIKYRQKIEDKTTFEPIIVICDEMEILFSDKTKAAYEIDYDKYPEFIEAPSGKMVKNPEFTQELIKARQNPTIGQLCQEYIRTIVTIGRSEKVHFIGATQNPIVKVIDSSIKANIPTRICLKVAQKSNSMVIIDQAGGEKLLGQGDMLLLTPEEPKPVRLQGFAYTDQSNGVEFETKCEKYLNNPKLC